MGLMFAAILPALLYPALCVAYSRRLQQKRLELESIMADAKNADLYRQAFGVKPDQLFVKSFGVVAYLVPVVVNAVGVWGLTVIFLTRHGLDVGLPGNMATLFTRLPRSVVAAFAGAFVWGMYDALRRYRAASLSPESLHFTWLRMLIAGSLAPFISALFNNGTGGDAIAFGLGAFPVKTLSDLIQGQVANRLQVSASAAPAEAPTLQALQGITPGLLETLSEADIDSTQGLAYADPLKLFLRTNIPWNVVLDLVDQALLCNYVGDKLKGLRVLGIRGSIELSSLHDAFSGGADSSGNVHVVVARIAELLNESIDAVLNLIDTVYFDYQVKFVAALWGDAYGGSSRNDLLRNGLQQRRQPHLRHQYRQHRSSRWQCSPLRPCRHFRRRRDPPSFNEASGRAAATCDRKRDEAAQGQHKPGRDTHERGSLGRFPVQNRPRALDPDEWRRQSRNEHNGSKHSQGPGCTRDWRDQHQYEPDADSESGDRVKPDGRNHILPDRYQTIGHEDAHHADDHDEESDQ
jgi:hypothetical protein